MKNDTLQLELVFLEYFINSVHPKPLLLMSHSLSHDFLK